MYYRHHRKRVIRRKQKIMKHYFWQVKNNEFGRLSKDKIHCSCWMCSRKTQRLGFPKTEKARIQSSHYQIAEYFQKKIVNNDEKGIL